MTNMQVTKKLELHYVFADGDGSHTLDAFTRNRCEQAFLKIVNEIANNLDSYVEIVVEPHIEGGLRDVYSFIVSPKGGSVAGWTGVAVSIILLVMQIPSCDDKVLTKLSIEKTTLEIEKLRLEINKLKGNDTNSSIENTLSSNIKIKKQKSNFYQKASECSKVNAIELSEIDNIDNTVIQKQSVYISRSDFGKFIVDEIPVEPEIIENTIVEIIAPVLIRSKIQWKGILKKNWANKPIDFKMGDNDFLKKVESKELNFKHGTHIECVLELGKKVDDDGSIAVSHYVVSEVIKIYDDEGTNTIFPRKRRKRTVKESQPTLFDTDGTGKSGRYDVQEVQNEK